MGGYGSGRRKRHQRTDDCLALDTTWLRKQKHLSGNNPLPFSIEWTKNTIIDFHQPKEQKHHIGVQVTLYGDQGGEFSRWDAFGQVDLFYLASTEPGEQRGAKKGKQKQSHAISLPLITTPCNYGGVRWWFLAPCCGRRARVVYIPTHGEPASVTPQCRECLDLHYPSQCASYIERHKTYERHLLANYGLWWAQHRYEWELKEHYLKVTPELEELRARSVLAEHLHFIKLLIRCEQTLLKSHLRNLQSLRSEEDRRVYLDHMIQQEQESGFNWAKMLGYGIELERVAFRASPATAAKNEEILDALETESRAQLTPEEAIETKIRLLGKAHKQATKEEDELRKAA